MSKINPQTENGHRRIASDVLAALIKQGMTGAEWAVCMTVIDKTYGFGKLSDQISLTQFQVATGLSRQGVMKAIKSLGNQRCLVGNHSCLPTEYLFNKHYDTWIAGRQPQLPIGNHSIHQLGNHSVPTKERRIEKIYIDDKIPNCPHQKIIDLYHETLPELRTVRIWNDNRKRLLASRWKESKKRQSLEWWKGFFEYVKDSPFLMGRKTDFEADLEWLIRPQNFAKVVEGKYHK